MAQTYHYACLMLSTMTCIRLGLLLYAILICVPCAVDAFVSPRSRSPFLSPALRALAESPEATPAEPLEAISSTDDGTDAENEGDGITAFSALSEFVSNCILQSDIKRIKGLDGASTGWTSWVDDEAAFKLQALIDQLVLSSPRADPTDTENDNVSTSEALERRDEAARWTRWMRACPSPMIIDLSQELRDAVNGTVRDSDLERVDLEDRSELLDRVGLRIILLPSGSSLQSPIRTPAGAMAYGKILFGGATRFRLLSGGKFGTPRRAGERTVIQSKGNDIEKSWLQYGGPERNYEAVDVGPCAILETIILPKGLILPSMHDDEEESVMALSNLGWNPHNLFDFFEPSISSSANSSSNNSATVDHLADSEQEQSAGKNQGVVLESTLSSSVGGCRDEISEIVRRACQGRALSDELGASTGECELEAAELAALGLSPVRGVLLYGPPGCGKTVLAREIAKALHARPPKIVSAPELLDRWVGSSEKLVRALFEDAEMELRACGGDASKSMLHVVVIDEIDAVFRKRTSAEDSGEATRASVVNQILAKLDGINAIPNVLVIGMTNRRELLDEALLRPGRLEVQVKIPLPDREGRREILKIHVEALRRRGRLSKPLCQAIDGVRKGRYDEKSESSFRSFGRSIKRTLSGQRIVDLASDAHTGGFSGADCAGLIRCAGSIALHRARQEGNGVEDLLITLEDVAEALEEVRR